MYRKIKLLILITTLIFFSFCRKDVKTIPDHLRKGTAEYYMNNGYKSLNLGSLNIAMEQFRKALKKKPGLMKSSMGLGIVYLKQRKFKESLKLFTDIAKHYPSNADAFNFMGIIHSELGNYESAKENFLIAANSQHYSTPENAFLNLALLEVKAKRLDNALRYIEKGIINNPEFVSLFNLKGSIYEEKGFYKKAKALYEQSLMSKILDASGIPTTLKKRRFQMVLPISRDILDITLTDSLKYIVDKS